MNEITKKILNDLYLIDKDLKKHEPKLIKLVEELLKARPSTKIDENFLKTLRTEVMKRAALLKSEPAPEKGVAIGWWWLLYALGGAVLTLAIIAPITDYLFSSGIMTRNAAMESGFKDAPEIARLTDHAFGALGSVNQASKDQSNIDPSAPSPDAAKNFAVPERAAASGGAGEVQTIAGSAKIMATGVGGGGSSATRMIGWPGPEYVNYVYSYTGGGLPALPATLPVYKRMTGTGAAVELAGLVSSAGMPALDFGKFQNLKITNFSASENRDYGYTVYYNFIDGMVNIDQDWTRWPQPGRDCADDACYERLRLTESDVPADADILRVADTFLARYGIDRSNFGPGSVRDEWRQNLLRAESANDIWIPDTITVVYPLKIDEKTAYDESGYANGINVSVNIREKKVANLNGVRMLDFSSSDYALETDVARLRHLAEQGGYSWGPGFFEGAKSVTVKLGMPTVELVAYWRYNENTGRSDELYVPAYVFPVLNKDEVPDLYRDKIVVILVKEILDEREPADGGIVPRPVPIPLIEKDTVFGGSAGGDEGVASEPLIMSAPETETIE